MSEHVDNLSNDQQLMQQVLDLASQGLITTQPNPCVGCLIVNDGNIVGEGWHRSAGSAHAERLALQQAGELARGSTVYVSLEPCCHQGRTPPCTDALISAGVSQASNFAKLSSMEVMHEGNGVHVTFTYETGAAAGQNMVTLVTAKVLKQILEQAPHRPALFYIEGNMSGDKKQISGH